jgi:3'-phosphoadenosine 5'-phosphosulfate sulfotransferase (PAPS reductase)/FAD synthetase
MSRTVSWFSCGAASAVATKLALANGPVDIVYCHVAEEHPDNMRFLNDCEAWYGQEIKILCSEKFNGSIYEVFKKTRYLVGPGGARCTLELKKRLRENYQQPNDCHVFGYTVEEQHRADRFIDANNDVDAQFPLIDSGLTKPDCLAMIQNAGIELPEMYKLGYHNNNCMGCVKAVQPEYWRKIQQDFPDMFAKMNASEKMLGRSVVKIGMKRVKRSWPDVYEKLGEPALENDNGNETHWRPQLDELPSDIIAMDNSPDIQCGIFCHIAEQGYT